MSSTGKRKHVEEASCTACEVKHEGTSSNEVADFVHYSFNSAKDSNILVFGIALRLLRYLFFTVLCLQVFLRSPNSPIVHRQVLC